MTVLSDNDIRKELGINILIYPFKEDNLKGASYNLTPSKFAWNLKDKQRLKYDEKEKTITIPKLTTALIETNETIWVSQKISGSYHSRVTQVSQGTGHIGTTLDPNYIGNSLVAIHNHSNDEVKLTVETEGFVTIIFQYVCTDSSRDQHGNSAGRKDILAKAGITLIKEEEDALDEVFMSNKDLLKIKLEECKDYQRIQSVRQKETEDLATARQKEAEDLATAHQKERRQAVDKLFKKLYIYLGIILVVMIFIAGFLYANQANWEQLTFAMSINT